MRTACGECVPCACVPCGRQVAGRGTWSAQKKPWLQRAHLDLLAGMADATGGLGGAAALVATTGAGFSDVCFPVTHLL